MRNGAGAARTAVVTGASSGVGLAAARRLAADGWRVIALGRDEQRCRAAEASIAMVAASGGSVHMLRGDLASLADVHRLAGEILSLGGRLHALLNNAGGVRADMSFTAEGNEATFAGNHLGPFLLTKRLLPALRETAATAPRAVRIVNVSSEGHRTIPAIDWHDLQRVAGWASGRNYSLAKLYNLLFTLELAQRETDAGIVVHAMHPGEAATNFAAHAVPAMQAYIASLDQISPDVGGRTLAWLATAAEAGQTTGGYFFDCERIEPAPQALDAAAAARLWQESEALIAHAGY